MAINQFEFRAYVPAIDDGLIPQWVARMRRAGIWCEIDPAFSFDAPHIYVQFCLRVERSPRSELLDRQCLSGFRLDIQPFCLTESMAAMPNAALTSFTNNNPIPNRYFSSARGDKALARCTKRLSLSSQFGDSLEFRVASASAAILARLTWGMCARADNSAWYSPQWDAQHALDLACAYEASIAPSKLRLRPFVGWGEGSDQTTSAPMALEP